MKPYKMAKMWREINQNMKKYWRNEIILMHYENISLFIETAGTSNQWENTRPHHKWRRNQSRNRSGIFIEHQQKKKSAIEKSKPTIERSLRIREKASKMKFEESYTTTSAKAEIIFHLTPTKLRKSKWNENENVKWNLTHQATAHRNRNRKHQSKEKENQRGENGEMKIFIISEKRRNNENTSKYQMAKWLSKW